MYGSLAVSTSGMIAQRTRLAVVASNIANSGTLLNAKGEYDPYRRREVFFAPGDPTADARSGRQMGVHVSAIEPDQEALRPKYAPGSPFADDNGYIQVPDISPAVEQVNALQASRAYEANVVAAETTKTMLAQSLRLLA